MGAILTALGTIGAIIAAGWVLGRRSTLGPAGAAVVARIVFTVATPCLLFVTIAHADLQLLVSRTALVTALSTTAVAIVAVVVMRGLWRRPAEDVAIAALASTYVSAGSLGLSIAVYLLNDMLAVIPTMLFQLLVLTPAALAVLEARAVRPTEEARIGASTGGDRPAEETRALAAASADDPSLPAYRGAPMSGAAIARDTAARTLRNPIIAGSLSGLLLAALPCHLPEAVFEPFSAVGATAAPLALLVFGMSLAVPRTHGMVPPRRELALVVALRSVVHPVLAATIGVALGLDGRDLLAVTAMAALPTAQNVLVYAIQYGRQVPLARDAGLVTTALAAPVLLLITAALT